RAARGEGASAASGERRRCRPRRRRLGRLGGRRLGRRRGGRRGAREVDLARSRRFAREGLLVLGPGPHVGHSYSPRIFSRTVFVPEGASSKSTRTVTSLSLTTCQAKPTTAEPSST